MKTNFILKTGFIMLIFAGCGEHAQDRRFSMSATTNDVQVSKVVTPTAVPVPTAEPTNPVVDPETKKISLQDWSALPAENNEFLIVPVKS